jgi:hypothetical protein
MTESRTRKRHLKRFTVKFGIQKNELKRGFTDDINHEGFFVRSAVVFPPGSLVHVEINHPDGQIVICGQIRWGKAVPANFIHKMKGGVGVKIKSFQSGQDIYQTLCDELVEKWGE